MRLVPAQAAGRPGPSVAGPVGTELQLTRLVDRLVNEDMHPGSVLTDC